MAAQPGTNGTNARQNAALCAAMPNSPGNEPSASSNTYSARAAAGPSGASADSHAVRANATSNPQQAQPATGNPFPRWFGAPFMPCFLGLAALRVWLQVNEFGGYAQSDNGIITILSNLTYGLTFLIAAGIAWRKPPTPRAEHAIAFIAAALMLVAPLLMLAGLAPNAGAIATAGALLVGIAGAFGGGMWACAYTRLPLKPALMYAFASLALGSLGGLAISFLPEGSRYIASLFMPAISLLCFERARAYTGDTPLGNPAGTDHGASPQANASRAQSAPANKSCTAADIQAPGRIAGAAPLTANASHEQAALANKNRQTSENQTRSRSASAAAMRFGKAASRPYDNEPKASLALIIGGIAVFGLALGLSRGFPAGSPVPFGLPVRLVHQLGVVAISAGFLWWIGAKGRHISFSLLWRLEIIIAATGAFILMVLPGAAMEIAVAIVNIADTLMLCVLFITAQDVARHSSLHPFVIFGGAWAARVLSRNLGRTVVFALSPMTQSESAVLGVIVLALSLSMVCLLSDNLPRMRKLFTYDDEPGKAATSHTSADLAPLTAESESNATADTATASSAALSANRESAAPSSQAQPASLADAPATQPNRPTPTAKPSTGSHPDTAPTPQSGNLASADAPTAKPEKPAAANADEQVREWLRTKHGLTAREIDVALLIARGRSKTFIADELFISENTVRTHSKNVYAKLGIHSREELISLFENRTHS